jgi:hypothetical protein
MTDHTHGYRTWYVDDLGRLISPYLDVIWGPGLNDAAVSTGPREDYHYSADNRRKLLTENPAYHASAHPDGAASLRIGSMSEYPAGVFGVVSIDGRYQDRPLRHGPTELATRESRILGLVFSEYPPGKRRWKRFYTAAPYVAAVLATIALAVFVDPGWWFATALVGFIALWSIEGHWNKIDTGPFDLTPELRKKVRALYPNATIYPSLDALLGDYPSRGYGAGRSPDNDPNFWTKP